jgi:putative exosortase-associated protein (TIGR04073 family)
MTITIRSMRGLTALAAVCALGVPMVSQADTAAQKAGRGLAAIFTPFLEIPGNIIETTEREGAAKGWTVGLAKGIGMFIIRPPIGVYELVTSPIPAPANYEPILEPEYPWSYFGSGDDSGVARR